MKLLKGFFALIALGTVVFSTTNLRAQSESPVIVIQPQSQSVAAGSAVIFTVEATGTDPLIYQWFLNGSEISGATDSAYSIAAVSVDHAGDYVVSVGNDVETVFSETATLEVVEAPTAQTFLDFNNDGNADLLWVHPDGRIVAWLMDGTNFLGSIVLPYRAPSGWKVAGQADFDKDGKFDFLWQHSNGRVAGWLMDGTNQIGTFTLPQRPQGGWRVVGLSDFNNDGSTDLLWQHGNGRVAAWLLDGTNFVESAVLNDGKRVSGGWKVAGLMDLDGDSDKDVLWQHGGGRLLVWYMSGLDIERAENFKFSGKTTSSWRVSGTSDMNGDGEEDLIWRHSEGYLAIWLMNGTLQPETGTVGKGKRVAKGWELRNR